MLTKVKGCCPLDCQDSCAWTAHVEDGRVIRVEGQKDHAITRGVLCTKVKDYEQRLTASDRLTHPLKRSGPKGSGQFMTVSWDEALIEIATRFKAIIQQHGAEALMPFSYLGTQGVVQRLALTRLFHALGASRATGGVCAMSAAALMAEGHPIGVDPEEVPSAKLVILWGQNVLTTCHHQWHFIEMARKNGAKLIAIDPCVTRTTQQCDVHLAPRPGTDVAIAACIGRHLLHSGNADLELASHWIADLEAYRAKVEPWTFTKAAELADVPELALADLAGQFAAARPALIRAGIAPQQARNGDEFVRGLSALAILGGHWRHRSGGLSILSMPAIREDQAARSDLIPGAPRSLDIARLGEILESAEPPVKGLFVWSANPAATQIDGPRVKKGLLRDDLFAVVADHFLTDTARHADIVLPATTQFEHVDVQGAWGHHYIMANTQAVAPMGEARSSGAIMRGLARHLGLAHPALHESDEDIARSALPDGWQLEQLLQHGWRKASPPRLAIGPLSHKLRIAAEVTATPAAPAGQLQLLSPKSHYFLNSTFANMPRQKAQQGTARLRLNPGDATGRNLAEGDTVTVQSTTGTMTLPVSLDAKLRRGVAALEGKWWQAGDDNSAAMNKLTAPGWAPSGQPAYNETFITVEKA